MTQDHGPLPIIKLWGALLVPLQGDVNDDFARRIGEEILAAVHRSEVEAVIIDISGMWLLDSHICSILANIGAAARLIGTQTIICGMSAEIAQTLQTMGVEMESVRSARSAEEAFELVGVKVITPAQSATPLWVDAEPVT